MKTLPPPLKTVLLQVHNSSSAGLVPEIPITVLTLQRPWGCDLSLHKAGKALQTDRNWEWHQPAGRNWGKKPEDTCVFSCIYVRGQRTLTQLLKAGILCQCHGQLFSPLMVNLVIAQIQTLKKVVCSQSLAQKGEALLPHAEAVPF